MKIHYQLPIALFFLLLSCGNIDKKVAIIELVEVYDKGNFEIAKEKIQTFLITHADNEYAWTLLGHVNKDLDNDSIAIVNYQKALELNSNLVEALTGLGIMSRIEGDYQKASEYYYKAIEIDPNYAQAYASLVVINLKNKKFDKAVEVGLKAYKLDKNDPVIVSNLAVAFHYIGDTINREKYLKIAKENGYKRIEILKKLFDNEMTVLD